MVLAAAAAPGCVDCEEVESHARVIIPDEDCTVGRCVEWRTGPCKKTCEAFLDSNVIEVTGCEPPRADPAQSYGLVVECRYVTQSCSTTPDFSFGSGRPQARHRPRGAACGAERTGRFFAAAAEAEESSVFAFRELARELAKRGAPHALVARCEAAANDEERHREIMTTLARARSAEPARAVDAPSHFPSLEAMAADNAAIGCVDELWSAALTTYAASFARERDVRRALASVARDEVGHAALAHDLAAAFAAQLDCMAARRVEVRRKDAIASLRRVMMGLGDDDSLVLAGLVPPRHARRALFDSLFEVTRSPCAAA